MAEQEAVLMVAAAAVVLLPVVGEVRWLAPPEGSLGVVGVGMMVVAQYQKSQGL